MKKVICLILILCMLLPFSVTVGAKSVTVSVNGERFALMPHPVIENEKTMVTTNLFLYLNCDVRVHNYYNAAIIRKGDKTILLQMDNNEYVVYTGSYEQLEEKINENSWSDEEKCTFSVTPHKIENYGFVPIRDLGEQLGYTIAWNNEKREVELTCEPSLQLTRSNDNDFVNNVINLLNKKEKEEKGLIAKIGYEAYNFDVLRKHGIIDDNESEYIKVTDALDVFFKIECDEDRNDYYLKDWYSIDELEVLDDVLDENTKAKLMNLYYFTYVISIDDILRLDYDTYMTHYDALLFSLRMIGDTYSCTDMPDEVFYNEKDEIYSRAAEKGLIDSKSSDNADKPILRKDFYEIINRAIFTQYATGGYAGVSYGRIVDLLERRSTNVTKEVSVSTVEINPDVVWNDDFSISVDVPTDIKERNFYDSVTAYTDSGKKVSAIAYGGYRDGISAPQLVEMVVKAYPEKLKEIEILYYKTDYDTNTKEEYRFTIDASSITAVCEGEAPVPGVYLRNKGEWPVKELSLKEGYSFEKGAYYILYSKQHDYRKDEYNYTGYATFKAEKDANLLDGFNKLGSFGTSYFEEIRLIEATVSGNSHDGFTLRFTPPSENTFEVKEK